MNATAVHAFWFSPVYHTRLICLAAGEALAARFGDIPLITHDLAKEALAHRLGVEDIAIMAIPVYAGRVPPLAAERLRLIESNGASAVLLASYGNRAYDDALQELYAIAMQTGAIPIGAAACVARHTIAGIYAQGRPNTQDLAEVREFAQNLSPHKLLDSSLLPGKKPEGSAKVFPLPQTVDENCVLCGHCWEECPARAITPNQPAEVDKTACICCMRCVSICPEDARIPDEAFIDAIRRKLAPLCEKRKPNEFFGI